MALGTRARTKETIGLAFKIGGHVVGESETRTGRRLLFAEHRGAASHGRLTATDADGCRFKVNQVS